MTGKEVLAARQQLGLTQAGLAEVLGVTANTVARWERDEQGIREPVARLIRVLLKSSSSGRKKGK